MLNPHEGHRGRSRDEFLKSGENFPEHRILEILLYYSIPRADTNVIAHGLMDRFGCISSIFDAPYELLREVEGIGESSATLIKLVSTLICKYMDDYTATHNNIHTTSDAKEYMRYKFLCQPVECVYMVCIGANGKVGFCDTISEGSPETVQIRSVDVIRKALLTKAVRVVLAHNHPNGICNPSSSDLRTTNILFEELRRVDIELFDHIIVAPDGTCSMKERGFFPKTSFNH